RQMRVWFFLVLLAIVPLQTRSGARPDSFAGGDDPQSDEEVPDILCGGILVRGSDQLTRTELCQLLDQASENPLDSESPDSAGTRVINEYHRRGFLGADLAWSDAENRSEIAAPAAILTITEGEVYRLHRLDMVGNENTRDNVIRRRVALHQGCPFDEELLALSIKRINQLGIFEEFRREDVGVKLNRKQHYVDVVFHLREKEEVITPPATVAQLAR